MRGLVARLWEKEGIAVADIFELFKKISSEKRTPAGPPTHIVAGLGNPGTEYLRTRHNAGFIALDHITQRLGIECSRARFHALCGQAALGGTQVLLMKPQTFMNKSGISIREAAEFYKIPPENIIVLVDDTCLSPGRMRIRAGGSDGGHNGLKSIIYHLDSDQFPRVRIGVGEKPKGSDQGDWVLGKLSEEDLVAMAPCFAVSHDAAALIIEGKLAEAQGKYNGMGAEKKDEQ